MKVLKLVKIIKDFKIKSMLDKGFNKKVIDEALNHLEKEIEVLEQDIIPLESDVSQLARSESLRYTLNEKTLCFSKEDSLNTMAYYSSDTGKIINDAFIEDKELLSTIANNYRLLKPKLIELKGLKVYHDIISGKNLFNAYLKEINFDNQSRIEKRKINREIRIINGEFFERTSLFLLDNNMFGDKDVDGNIKTGIILNDEWTPYSNRFAQRIKEQEIIDDNQDLLDQFKNLYFRKKEITNIHGEHIRDINKQSELRHRVINEVLTINSKDSLIRK